MNSPLIPRDVDLSGFDTMPLKVADLLASAFMAESEAEEFRAGVALWCAAFHQVPAGSVPDKDKQLSDMAGFGRAVNEWKKWRRGALYGFVSGGDGRLYHKKLCRIAFFDCWMPRLRWLHDAECERLRKWNKAHSTQPLTPPTLAMFVRQNYPYTAAYLDVLDRMTPSCGWVLLHKKQRRGLRLPELLPFPPNICGGSGGNSAGSFTVSAGSDAPDWDENSQIEPENSLKGEVRESKQIPPLPPLQGGDEDENRYFAMFLAAGGARWHGLRPDRARIVWDERRTEGADAQILIACAKAYMAHLDGEDRRRREPRTAVGPAAFLKGLWANFRGEAALMAELTAAEVPDLGEPGERLRGEFGDAAYAAMFAGAVLEPGNPFRIAVVRSAQRIMIDSRMSAVRRCLRLNSEADLIIEVRA